MEQLRVVERPTFVRRLVVAEEPAVVAELEQRAYSAGHSVAAEVRQAIRAHLRREEPA